MTFVTMKRNSFYLANTLCEASVLRSDKNVLLCFNFYNFMVQQTNFATNCHRGSFPDRRQGSLALLAVPFN